MPPRLQVYVLRNPASRLNIGLSEDVPRRLEQHDSGVSKWTAKFRPWALVWTSASMSVPEAKSLEYLLKRQKGGRGRFKFIGWEFPGS